MVDRVLYQISPSKVQAWLDCPRKFWFSHVGRVRVNVEWAHLTMGNALHNALRDWWDVPPSERTEVTAGELLTRHWSGSGFRDQAQADQWLKLATTMLNRYLDELDPEFVPFSCERTLAFRTDRLAITTRIDRLDADPDADPDGEGLIVVDYKTGKRIPNQDDVRSSLALAMYALSVQRTLRRPCSKVQLHHVPSTAIADWEHSEQALSRHLRRVEDIADQMRTAEDLEMSGQVQQQGAFEPTPGPLCGWCNFHSLCPQGMQAASPQLPWAGLPEAADDPGAYLP